MDAIRPDADELNARVKANWSAGDFRKLAVFPEPVAQEFIAPAAT